MEQVQRRAVRRTVGNIDRQDSVTRIQQELGCCTLEQRRGEPLIHLQDCTWNCCCPPPSTVTGWSRYCHSMVFRPVCTSRDYYKYSFPSCHSSVECSSRGCCIHELRSQNASRTRPRQQIGRSAIQV